jgi:alpha-mannosidase
MKDKTLYMIGNAHIDPVWLWQWQEGFHEVKATFRSALDRMKEYEEFTFVSSSAAFYEWVEKSDPDMFLEIQTRVKEGRWLIVGGWWLEPDCNLPGGESFVRQALYGQRYFKEKFGISASIGYNVDSFGHHAMLPQILKKSGLDYYIFMRPMPHEMGLPSRLFWWESDDGSRVLAYRLPYDYCTWGAGLENHVMRCAEELKLPQNSSLCFYGVGNHGGGPTRENLESIRRMNSDPNYPELTNESPEQWFENIAKNGCLIPVVHNELQHHASGCYSAHSDIKRLNRKAENLLITAEKFCSIADWITKQPYPLDFEKAWKNVLFNQFHDILAGTSLEDAYEDARDLYGEAFSIAHRGLNYAVQSLAWQIKIDEEEGMTPIIVFNPNAWQGKVKVELEYGILKENDVLLDEFGRVIPLQIIKSRATAKGRSRLLFVTDLPPLGYRTHGIAHRHGCSQNGSKNMLSAGDDFLENERLRVQFDMTTGDLSSIYDKHENVEVLAGPGAVPVVISDGSDTWGHNVFRFDQIAGRMTARKTALVEEGPVRATLRVVSEYGRSQIIQDFSLYRELEIIEVRVKVSWHEKFKALKLRFPVNLSHMSATSEIPYGNIERFANGEEEPCQSWIDLSGISRDNGKPYGLSLLNDGKYSFDINVRDIGLTVLRSPIYAHHIPVEPDTDEEYAFIDQGNQKFNYIIHPHSGSWEKAGTCRKAAELNQQPIILVGTYRPEGKLPLSGSFLSVDKDNLIAAVLKKSEDGDDLILRCIEVHGEAVETVVSFPFWDRAFTAQFMPYEIKTFRVPRDNAKNVIETNFLEQVMNDM